MATQGWGETRPVERILRDEVERFDFYQAVRLIEWIEGAPRSVGETPDPGTEGVRFRSHVDLAFPASDVLKLERLKTPGRPAELTVNFLGLAGWFGPLPGPDTERILERVFRHDSVFRDFLDIINHRLVSLMYRVRKTYRIGLGHKSPEHGNVAHCLYSLLGLGTGHLRNRLRMPDRGLLLYAGLLAGRTRSLVGLEGMLSHYFGLPFRGHPFVGQWYDLDEDQWTVVGRKGRNQVLGRDGVVLGRRSWTQQAKLELELGPLSLREFQEFLPIGRGLVPLTELTQFYLSDPAVVVDFRLALGGEEVPPSRLEKGGGPRLGWTSWLQTQPRAKGEIVTVVVSPQRLRKTADALPPEARRSLEPPPLRREIAA
jgi:type VI secretion system protein ImpH